MEVVGVESTAAVSSGSLQVSLTFAPPFDSTDPILSEVDKRVLDEKKMQSEAMRLYCRKAKDWWSDFIAVNYTFEQRQVQLFARDERGVDKPVNSFVTPMMSGLLCSPIQSARFVTQISSSGHRQNGPNTPRWLSPHTIFVQNQATDIEKAMLLCSFFLGFHTDAYVCLGTTYNREQCVCVIAAPSDEQITIWDMQSEKPIIIDFTKSAKLELDDRIRICRADCLFNDTVTFANIQPSSKIDDCSFKLTDDKLWKVMSASIITGACNILRSRKTSTIPLRPNLTFESLQIIQSKEKTLGLELKVEIENLRKQLMAAHGQTVWDDSLTPVLSSALWSYEQQKLVGVPEDKETFSEIVLQQTIKHLIPRAHTFRAFPICFNHLRSKEMMKELLRSETCRAILLARGDQVRFTAAVKIVTYPEQVFVCWLMIAVKYIPLV